MADTADGGSTAIRDELMPGAMGELVHIRALLQAELLAERSELLQIVVGNFDRREQVLLDSPGQGARRVIVPRYGQGVNGIACPAGVVTELCEQNEGRLGGLITNNSAAACRLYLCPPGDVGGNGNALSGQAPQRPAIWLPPNGPGWNFLLGAVLYGGPVCAAGVGGISGVDVAEF